MASDSTTSTYIVRDLLVEILLRLPLKSIIRFKSVFREWQSSIETEDFVERHMKNSRQKILLALPGCNNDGDPPSLVTGEKEEEFCYIRNCDASNKSMTCDGLLCIPRNDSIEVCNPATQESRRFPIGEPLVSTKPPPGKGRISIRSIQHRKRLDPLVTKSIKTRCSFGFGKDEVTRTYKVVKLRASNSSLIVEDCNVLDLQTGEWRHVSVVFHRIFCTERSVYVNGSVHWFTVDLWEKNAPRIVAFDLHMEEFRLVSHPNVSSEQSPHFSELLSLRNRLSVSEMRTVPDVQLDIWSMVDVTEERWAKMHSICLCLQYQRRLITLQLFTPLAISDQEDGLVILWDYKETLFNYYPNMFSINKVSLDARHVVATSYLQTLVRVR